MSMHYLLLMGYKMKYVFIVIAGLLIITTIMVLINLIIYLNKNQKRKVNSIIDGLNKRINLLKYLSIIIV